ncbi:MAG: hypothetical protein IPP97_11360 [Candidatus Obscuribacter sp.]|nr:hypothetical protein [Candidatus Obscuribacter sp.]MBP6349554.1 hypothetical protein [Candidatus Obscuribacter sp.]MBP6593428.1 hypothetical protein [Candidatus Obscuribacter sp.]MBP7578637.1 hypothetical protein [Candidatus Obscuribacter sp.]
MNQKPIVENGIIERDGNGFVVKVQGKAYLAELPGVYCENPNAPEGQRIYCKKFSYKKIYLHNQYQQAVQEVLTGHDVVVLGMNGYSALSEPQCLTWGVKPGAYEAACEGILDAVCESIKRTFPGIDIRFADGASNVGVDKVLLKVAKDMNRPHLGHSCPKFMFYVQDDGLPVYVAKTQREYADAFIDSLQILIAANGRVQAFEHDIDAVFKKLKHLIPVNVLKSISSNGGPPAIGPDGKIEDAVAAFEQRVHMATQAIYSGRDPYRSMVGHVSECTAAIVRTLISPERAFARVY